MRCSVRSVVGVSGKYCAGKSTVADLLEREWGFHQIDVDSLGHEALRRQRNEIVRRFGNDIADDGDIDRRRLGAMVFRDPKALADLEAIVHPEMIRMVKQQIAERSERDIAVNAAILFKMGLDRFCDLVIWVEAPIWQRFRRARERDHLSIDQIARRFLTQRRMKPQSSGSSVDTVTVRNSGNLEDLQRRLRTVLPA